MPEEYESATSKFNFNSILNLMLHLGSIFLTFIFVMGVIGITLWSMRQFVPLTIFEASMISVGVWGIVIMMAIYNKIQLIEHAVSQEGWDEEYEFYSEEEEELFDPKEPIDRKNRSNRGNVIHLNQKLFSEKGDKK